jgi:hypothetical protein
LSQGASAFDENHGAPKQFRVALSEAKTLLLRHETLKLPAPNRSAKRQQASFDVIVICIH